MYPLYVVAFVQIEVIFNTSVNYTEHYISTDRPLFYLLILSFSVLEYI